MKRTKLELFLYDVQLYGRRFVTWTAMTLAIVVIGTILAWLYSWPARLVWNFLDSLV